MTAEPEEEQRESQAEADVRHIDAAATAEALLAQGGRIEEALIAAANTEAETRDRVIKETKEEFRVLQFKAKRNFGAALAALALAGLFAYVKIEGETQHRCQQVQRTADAVTAIVDRVRTSPTPRTPEQQKATEDFIAFADSQLEAAKQC